MRPAHRALSRRRQPTPSGRPARRSLCYSCLSSIPGLMLPSGGPGSASPAFTARSMQPTVKERHLSHGLSAQHETTYFAGTGAIQAIEQPAPVLTVCAGLTFWYRGVVEFGAHLPLMDFGGHPFTLDHLLRYARTAEHLGFDMLCANDHLVFAVPWLDGPTALAAVIEASGQMTLATTVALVAVRGPVPVAKALAAIDRLSGGRLLVAAGPGSSPAGYPRVCRA